MHAVFSLLPLMAAVLAVPQFLPQLARLRRTGETAGVSWSWAALTSINNAAWAGYFALSGFWTALAPAISATVLAGALAVMLARSGTGFPRRPAALTLVWAALLTAAGLSGRAGLGTALTAAFGLQVTPSVWTAYRADRTTGIAIGTWLLILGELLCWGVFGLYESDPRLIVLGATGVTASLLVLARAARPPGPPVLSRQPRLLPPKLLLAGQVRSRAGRAERRRDLPDSLFFRGADALTVLPVGGGDLAGEGEHETPVVITFLGGRLAFQQCHGVPEVSETAVPELGGRVIPRVVHFGLRRHDLVEEFALAVLGARFGVGL